MKVQAYVFIDTENPGLFRMFLGDLVYRNRPKACPVRSDYH